MTLSSPPSTPIDWLATTFEPYRSTQVTARTWYEARARAAVLLGADPHRVKVTPMGGSL